MQLRLEVAARAAQHDLFGNDVPGVAAVHLRHGDDGFVLRVDGPADDRLDRTDQCSGSNNWVVSHMRHCRVGATA